MVSTIGFAPTVSGTRRALLGTLLLIMGLALTVTRGNAALQAWMLRDSSPVAMSCFQLAVQEGSATGLARLTDAKVVMPDLTLSEDQEPAATFVETLSRRARKAMDHPRLTRVSDHLRRGEIVPRHARKLSGSGPLQLGIGRATFKQCESMLERENALTVTVVPDRWLPSLLDLVAGSGMPVPAHLAAISEQPRLILSPFEPAQISHNFVIWFGSSFACLTLGLLFCLNAPAGRWIILSPVAGAISVFGYPLRRGHDSKFASIVCVAAVVGLGIAGYQTLIVKGGLGGSTGDPVLWTVGLLAIATALALSLVLLLRSLRWTGRQLHMRLRRRARPTIAKEPGTTKGTASLATMMDANADPLAAFTGNSLYMRRYLDPRLSVISGNSDVENGERHTNAWETIDFDAPLLIEIARGDAVSMATLQLGCRSTVLAMTDYLEPTLRLRLVSILHNGQVVVTLSNNHASSRCLANETGLIHISDANDAPGILAHHLEALARAAEQAGTRVVTQESGEWRDVIHYAECCVAEIRHRSGDEKWDLSPTGYGRFSFPVHPVATAGVG
ncbi:MAG: hypothetical protein AAGD07_13560 [Planctomycetota bacterium]